MIVVSGCPRSGTSLMMDCFRIALGEDRIIGSKFPQEDKIAIALAKRENETDEELEARRYMRNIFAPNAEKDFKISKDMNPNGFWECHYTVRGIQYHIGMTDMTGKICKIVSQGLFSSNPQYIEKIIYMLRDPRQVAKSQERLKRLPFLSHEEEMNQELKVHTPEMFIHVSYQAAQWVLENPEVPIMNILFDDLIMFPNQTLDVVKKFIGEGDFSKHQIDPKLKRSYPEVISNRLWEYADTIYEYMKMQNYEKVVEYYKENAKYIHLDNVSTLCTRLHERMVYNECINCQKSKHLVKNLIKRAGEKNIAWQFEPCLFECLTDPLSKHISIKESVRNNHWVRLLKDN